MPTTTHRHHPINRVRWAFTLIELIVSLIILGVLASVAMVGYTAVTDRAQVTAVKSQVTQVAKALLVAAAADGVDYFDRALMLQVLEDSFGGSVTDGISADGAVRLGLSDQARMDHETSRSASQAPTVWGGDGTRRRRVTEP